MNRFVTTINSHKGLHWILCLELNLLENNQESEHEFQPCIIWTTKSQMLLNCTYMVPTITRPADNVQLEFEIKSGITSFLQIPLEVSSNTIKIFPTSSIHCNVQQLTGFMQNTQNLNFLFNETIHQTEKLLKLLSKHLKKTITKNAINTCTTCK